MKAEPLLEVTNLSVTFPSEAGPVTAVRGLSYHVMPGEVLGIVGESGSGKSVSSLDARSSCAADTRHHRRSKSGEALSKTCMTVSGPFTPRQAETIDATRTERGAA